MLAHCESLEWSLFHATMVCLFHSTNAGSILINPSDLYPQSSGFVFGVMNTAGAIPGNAQLRITINDNIVDKYGK